MSSLPPWIKVETNVKLVLCKEETRLDVLLPDVFEHGRLLIKEEGYDCNVLLVRIVVGTDVICNGEDCRLPLL